MSILPYGILAAHMLIFLYYFRNKELLRKEGFDRRSLRKDYRASAVQLFPHRGYRTFTAIRAKLP